MPNIVVWPLSRGSSVRSRGVGGIVKVIDAKDDLVEAYKSKRSFGEVWEKRRSQGVAN